MELQPRFTCKEESSHRDGTKLIKIEMDIGEIGWCFFTLKTDSLEEGNQLAARLNDEIASTLLHTKAYPKSY
jgi:hypothetical protein